jgi:CheY-like chemotaxis protein
VPAKLLIADDSTTIQKVFERTFPADEFTLSFANNGEEALAKARTERPSLIIADISMPVKSGFEVCATLKQDPAFKGTPVLLLIGILDDFDEDESRRVGADGFIVKPFEATAAISKVRAVLAKGGRPLPTEGTVGGQAEEILELFDTVKGSPTARSPLQRQGAEEILELADIIKESPSPPPPQRQGTEEILELADIMPESPSAPPPQKKKEEEFFLQSSLRELEEELKAEFPKEKEEDEEPLILHEEKKESWHLDLDLPLDELELEPRKKNADWSGLFGDVSIEGRGQEIKDERLETILGESTTELEKIEGLAQKKDERAKKKEEEFAEKFMEDFEPVFAPDEDRQHIDVLEKGQKRLSSEDVEDVAQRVATVLGRELKGMVEEVIKNKVPKLVRQVMEQSKKG